MFLINQSSVRVIGTKILPKDPVPPIIRMVLFASIK